MSKVSNIFFRWNQSVIDYPVTVGEEIPFTTNAQKSFKKCINWMIVGNRKEDVSPTYIAVRNIKNKKSKWCGLEYPYAGDVIAVLDGDWSEVNYLFTTYAGNGSNSVPREKGKQFAIELSKRLREQNC